MTHFLLSKCDQKEFLIIHNIAKSENKDLLIYQKKPMNLLKDILRKNKCKVGGKKQDLIDRILINKKNNSYWI